MLLDAAQVVDRQALRAAVEHFNSKDNVSSILANIAIASSWSVAGLLQQYHHLLTYPLQKFRSLTNLIPTTPSEGAMYRKEILLPALQHSGNISTFYASDVLISCLAAPSFSALYKQHYRRQLCDLPIFLSQVWKRLPQYSKLTTLLQASYALCSGITSLGVPILASYALYVAMRLHQPALLTVGAIALAGILLFAIWDNQQLTFRHKAAYSAGIPITYSFFFVLSLLRIIVLSRGLTNRKMLARFF